MALKLVCPCLSKKNDTSSPSSPGGKGDSGGVAVEIPRGPVLAFADDSAALPRNTRFPTLLLLPPPPKQKARVKLFLAVARAIRKPPGAGRGLPGLRISIEPKSFACFASVLMFEP